MNLTTVETIQLDLKELTMRHAFAVNHSSGQFSWGYECGEKVVRFDWDFIRYPNGGRIAIRYQMPIIDGKTKSVAESISLVTTPCNFGGRRYWAICPKCSEKARVLYLSPSGGCFCCIGCSKVVYPSQKYTPKGLYDVVDRLEIIDHLKDQLLRLRSPRRIKRIQEQINRHMAKLKGIGYQGRRKIAWQP